MSGLFTTLNSSSTALNAHSRAIETTGKNLANVNNPNYARQRVVYGDRGTVETPLGAQSLGLETAAAVALGEIDAANDEARVDRRRPEDRQTDRAQAPPRIATIVGKSTAHTSDAIEALWKPRAITTHTMARTRTTSGNTTTSAPVVSYTFRHALRPHRALRGRRGLGYHLLARLLVRHAKTLVPLPCRVVRHGQGGGGRTAWVLSSLA